MEGTFYTHKRSINFDRVREIDPLLIFSSDFWLTETSIMYNRRIYGWFDLLGDIGGVTEVLILIFSFIFNPISEHLFILKAI